ncbi:MAG: 30S ribosomal protein S6e [Candidatus Woesearchaeota archaeon]
MEFKVVIAKDGKCVQREVKDDQAEVFLNKKIGETITGDSFGLSGYEFLITGGSDRAGFPMRKDLPGAGRKRILAVKGIGVRKKRHGQRQRKTVSGSTIYAETAQINLKVLKAGKEDLFAAPEAPTAEE